MTDLIGSFFPGKPGSRMMRIGVDVGGTKIEAIALDSKGDASQRLRVKTPRASYADTIMTIGELVDRLCQEARDDATVGVCMPGAQSLVTGLIKNANSTQLNGRPFADDLGRSLGRPIRIANDANCFALSESIDGAAAGHRGVFGVILGTGVGGGIVIDRSVWTGRNAIAGEWGHNPLPPGGASPDARPACYCGRFGCLETYLSGPALSADHARRTRSAVSPRTIASLARSGDPEAVATMDLFYDRLCRGLAMVVNIVDPDIIVLGGGLSNIDEIYQQDPLRMPRYVFSDSFTTPIVRNRHGDSSGVRGAAWLWPA